MFTISCNSITNNSVKNTKFQEKFKEDSIKLMPLIEKYLLSEKKISEIDSLIITDAYAVNPFQDSAFVINRLETTIAVLSLIDSTHMQIYGTKKFESLSQKEREQVNEIQSRIKNIQIHINNKTLDTASFNGYYLYYYLVGSDSLNKEVKEFDVIKTNSNLSFVNPYSAQDDYYFKDLSGVNN